MVGGRPRAAIRQAVLTAKARHGRADSRKRETSSRGCEGWTACFRSHSEFAGARHGPVVPRPEAHEGAAEYVVHDLTPLRAAGGAGGRTAAACQVAAVRDVRNRFRYSEGGMPTIRWNVLRKVSAVPKP